jgi:hypothetical protein
MPVEIPEIPLEWFAFQFPISGSLNIARKLAPKLAALSIPYIGFISGNVCSNL